MAKRNIPDSRQMTLDFNYEEKVDTYVSAKQEILEAMDARPKPSQPVESEFEACVEIAAAIKQAIRPTGMSRDQVVDEINAYFGRTDENAAIDPPTSRKPLTIHMLNNYLSKPIEYPLPAYYLYAIHHVTGSLLPAEAIVSVEGAKVATGMEIRHMTLGKLEQSIAEMQQLKKELKKG
jgi:hypothetical protein